MNRKARVLRRWCACVSLFLIVSSCGSGAVFGQGKKKTEKDGPPRVTVILPLGAAAGQMTRVIVRGLKLEGATEIKILDGNGTAKIISKDKANVPDKNPEKVGDTQVVAEITLKEKLSGAVQVVIVTCKGRPGRTDFSWKRHFR